MESCPGVVYRRHNFPNSDAKTRTCPTPSLIFANSGSRPRKQVPKQARYASVRRTFPDGRGIYVQKWRRGEIYHVVACLDGIGFFFSGRLTGWRAAATAAAAAAFIPAPGYILRQQIIVRMHCQPPTALLRVIHNSRGARTLCKSKKSPTPTENHTVTTVEVLNTKTHGSQVEDTLVYRRDTMRCRETQSVRTDSTAFRERLATRAPLHRLERQPLVPLNR